MQRVIGVLFVIVLASFALAACGGKTQTVTENDNGKTVTVNTGDKLIVKLDGNPTTGYTWQLNNFDTSLLESAGEPDYKTDSLLIGSGGRYTYTFAALKPGEVTLQFNYLRTWEKDIPPVENFSITVDVK